ncbi:DMT family transporter [Dongia deserti]|uniref:DMT family transporter n=1 Tax=Dongia deserti TaxID=2268030 RepID=UPI000E65B43E|nr:DMT family transporter [Dongia deserti]
MLPSLAILVSATFWGSMWMPLHAAYGTGLSGAWVAWIIYGVPAFLVLPLILRDRGRGLLAGGWPLLWLGVSTGICNYLYAASVVYGDVARVVLLFYVNPVWSVLLERAILRTPLTPGRTVALAVGLTGMFVLNYDGQGLPLPRTIAEWGGLAAGFFWAVGLVTMRMTPHVGMAEKAFLQYVAAMITGGAVLALGVFPAQTDWSAVNWPVAIFWIAIIAGIWVLPGLLLSFWAAARMSPTRASMLFMAEVVVGVVTAAIWTDYPFGWREAIGGSIIVSASVLEIIFGVHTPTVRETGKA